MVNVDLPWWQWHLNGSRLSFLCLCRNIILLIRNNGEFLFIVCRLWYLFCCDFYKEIKMAAFFIYIVTIFLLLVGGEILISDVMPFWECLHFCSIGLHFCKRCSIMNSVDKWAVITDTMFVFFISFEEISTSLSYVCFITIWASQFINSCG